MGRTVTEWVLELIDNLTAPLRSAQEAADSASGAVNDVAGAAENVNRAGDKMPSTAQKIGTAMFMFNQVADAVGRINQEFKNGIAPGTAFNAQIHDVSAITGLAGNDLDILGGKARALAKEFGGSAAGQLESFKGVIGRFGPDIANSDAAMEGMGRNITVLSKLMGNDAVKAMDALTTSMLQYGVDLTNPLTATNEMTRMMNVMVAAGNEGSSEVEDTAAALKVAGLSAKNANVSFEEINAALQALGDGSLYGAEAGTGLRNVFIRLAGEDILPRKAREKLAELGVDYDLISDKSTSFTDRLRELKKIQGDATLTAQIFGAENMNVATVLLNSIDKQDALKEKITGTNAAFDGAAIVMDSYNERMARTDAWVDDLKIGFFNAIEPIAPFIEIIGGAITGITSLGMAVWGLSIILKKDLWLGIGSAVKGIGMFIKSAAVGTVSAIKFAVTGGLSFTAFKAAAVSACRTISVAIYSIPIIGWIAAAIAAIAALIAYFYNTSASFRGFLWGMWEAIKAVFTGVGQFITEVLEGIWHLIKGVFNPANWFNDDYKFADGLDKITGAAKHYGEEIGKAFQEGKAAGLADFEAGKAAKDKEKAGDPFNAGAITASSLTNGGGNNDGGGNNNLKNLNIDKGPGGGGSSNKNITMNITMHNHFSGVKNLDEAAEYIASRIFNRVGDGLAAL